MMLSGGGPAIELASICGRYLGHRGIQLQSAHRLHVPRKAGFFQDALNLDQLTSFDPPVGSWV
jgi:hypothetical protein